MAVVSIRVSKIDPSGALKDSNADQREPNRISSSGRHGSDPFMLDQRSRSVFRVPRRTALDCNPNCNLQIRRLRRVVQGRLSLSVCWADIPHLSTSDRGCLAAWQQYWQQSPTARNVSDRCRLRPHDGHSRSLPCGPPPHPEPSRPGCGSCAPPLLPIGLTAADLFAGGEVSRADSRVR